MEAFARQWEKAGISDGYIFSKVMLNPDLCKRMLEIILNIKYLDNAKSLL